MGGKKRMWIKEKERGRSVGKTIAKTVIILLFVLLGITLLAMSGTIPYNPIAINGISYALVSLVMLLVGMTVAIRCKMDASSLGIKGISIIKRKGRNKNDC